MDVEPVGTGWVRGSRGFGRADAGGAGAQAACGERGRGREEGEGLISGSSHLIWLLKSGCSNLRGQQVKDRSEEMGASRRMYVILMEA